MCVGGLEECSNDGSVCVWWSGGSAAARVVLCCVPHQFCVCDLILRLASQSTRLVSEIKNFHENAPGKFAFGNLRKDLGDYIASEQHICHIYGSNTWPHYTVHEVKYFSNTVEDQCLTKYKSALLCKLPPGHLQDLPKPENVKARQRCHTAAKWMPPRQLLDIRVVPQSSHRSSRTPDVKYSSRKEA